MYYWDISIGASRSFLRVGILVYCVPCSVQVWYDPLNADSDANCHGCACGPCNISFRGHLKSNGFFLWQVQNAPSGCVSSRRVSGDIHWKSEEERGQEVDSGGFEPESRIWKGINWSEWKHCHSVKTLRDNIFRLYQRLLVRVLSRDDVLLNRAR